MCLKLLQALATKDVILEKLNLSQNAITDKGVGSVDTMLAHNKSLKSLLLHWNQIGPRGGIRLARGLKDNSTLKILDLSWNSLGLQCLHHHTPTVTLPPASLPSSPLRHLPDDAFDDSQIGREWGEALGRNIGLVHVDLSNNNFNQ